MTRSGRLKEIRERVEKASPGPWSWYWRKEDGQTDCGVTREPIPGHVYSVCRAPRYENEGPGSDNLWFIAHAREDIPFLLQELAEQEKEHQLRLEQEEQKRADWNVVIEDLQKKCAVLGEAAKQWESEARDFPKIKGELEYALAARDCAVVWVKELRKVVMAVIDDKGLGDMAKSSLEKTGTLLDLFPESSSILTRLKDTERRLAEREKQLTIFLKEAHAQMGENKAAWAVIRTLVPDADELIETKTVK